MCNSDPTRDPRPNRMIHWLKDEHQVTVVSDYVVDIDKVESVGLFVAGPAVPPGAARETPPPVSKWNTINAYLRKFPEWFVTPLRMVIYLIRMALILVRSMPNLIGRAIRRIKRTIDQNYLKIQRNIFNNYEPTVWANLGRARLLRDQLAQENFDLIITHDITLMPLACGAKSANTKILLDAREYYTRNFEDQFVWSREIKPINEYLCNAYLSRCDKIITVSDGLAEEYAREYRVEAEVIMSLPAYRELSPVRPQNHSIRIIHHGYASSSRKLELMIEMMDYLDERFSLDLMLLVGAGEYWEKIVSMAAERKNVRLIPPVPMDQIVLFTNQYDIGLFLCPPTNFNLTYTLPNKFFEFIQARLAVAIGPSVEMKKIVERYDCGIVSSDFEPGTLAAQLNLLTPEKIMAYKNKSDRAARELNADTNRKRMLEIVDELIN